MIFKKLTVQGMDAFHEFTVRHQSQLLAFRRNKAFWNSVMEKFSLDKPGFSHDNYPVG